MRAGAPGQTGDRAAGAGQLHARHLDGALVEIGTKHVFDGISQIAERFEIVCQRPVAESRLGFGTRDVFVDMDIIVLGGCAQKTDDLG